MKEWFKYEYGFVNIDSENIYFTNTGNWSETKNLKEKGNQKSKTLKKLSIQLFLVFSVSVIGILFIRNISSGKFNWLFLFGLPVGAYYVYTYLKPELGANFKLPISKVVGIEIDNKNAVIEFENSKKEILTQSLENIELKGLDILDAIAEKK